MSLPSLAIASLSALLVIATADSVLAQPRQNAKYEDLARARPAGPPILAIVALGEQRVTIYDAEGPILRAPISSGQPGYETPAGIYSVIGKEAEHYSNLYDDASMPFMQRITWSGIALHAGPLPGRPASHGCVRMPYSFAEHLFGLTKTGMRVVIVRNDIRPTELSQPALFKPTPGGGDEVSLIALNGAEQAPQRSPTLKSIAAAKSAAAEAATTKAEEARKAAVLKRAEAARHAKALRSLEMAKSRAEVRLTSAERGLETAKASAVIERLEREKADALSDLSEAQAKLEAAKAETQGKMDAAEEARLQAGAADTAKVAALEEAKEALRKIRPLSVFISRNTQRIYVRQDFQPLFDSPVTIADADQPIGTHILTAVKQDSAETELKWSSVSMYSTSAEVGASRRHSRSEAPVPITDGASVQRALDRITIPHDALSRISEVMSPGSSLIISDESMSKETGKGTDFIILMSGEPQGGIKIRRRDPMARFRYQRPSSPGQYTPFSWW